MDFQKLNIVMNNYFFKNWFFTKLLVKNKMNEQKENQIKDPCMFCCFPCLIIWTCMEESIKNICLCSCKILCCDFDKSNELKK